uniref:Uncharacterized protein n=1 Tax=Anopheles darlingi TaxID=43151 RepID=A0A2M4DFK1_ANODA
MVLLAHGMARDMPCVLLMDGVGIALCLVLPLALGKIFVKSFNNLRRSVARWAEQRKREGEREKETLDPALTWRVL